MDGREPVYVCTDGCQGRREALTAFIEYGQDHRVDAVGPQKGRGFDLVDNVINEEAVRLEPHRVDHRIGTDSSGHQH